MARYRLYKDGKFVNAIEADLMFTMAFCRSQGLTYDEITDTIDVENETSQAKHREEAYNTQAIIEWNGAMLTVTQAAQQWQYYSAEGNIEKANKLTEMIAKAKASIREQYPDEEVSE